MVILDERSFPWLWGASAVLFAGLFPVHPRRSPRDDLTVGSLDVGG